MASRLAAIGVLISFLFPCRWVFSEQIREAPARSEILERLDLLEPALKGSSVAELIRFADQLFEKEDYYNALTVYQFALFKNPPLKSQERLRFRIAQCYQFGKRWEEAEVAFNEFLSIYPKSTLAPEASYRIGQGFFLADDFSRALERFRETEQDFPDSEYAVAARYAIGLSLARQGKWEISQDELAGLIEKYPGHDLAKNADRLSRLLEDGKSLPHKSPLLAGVLSVVPGLGKLYTTHYGGALVAFLVNSALGFVIYDSFDHERYAVGGVFSALAAATYSANIVGGYRSAKRYNALREDEFSQTVAREGFVPALELEK